MWQVQVFSFDEHGTDALLEDHLHRSEEGAKVRACALAGEYSDTPVHTFQAAQAWFDRHETLDMRVLRAQVGE